MMQDPLSSQSSSLDKQPDGDFVSSCNETINCLQQVIRRFSDHPVQIPPSKAQAFWQNSSSRRTLKDIVHLYAPVNLESQFEQLYCLLHPCLVHRDNETNAAAFCIGHRGMGKGMLLERCLQAFRDELRYAPTDNRRAMFRVVQVHGVLIPGHDVGLVVKDILQQLSQAAFEESAEIVHGSSAPEQDQQQRRQKQWELSLAQEEGDGDDNDNNEEDEGGRRKRQKKTTQLERGLRLRQSTFESNLQLLSETLKLARVDQIPILIVLDEVEAFLGGASNSSSEHSNSNQNINHLEKPGGRDRQLLLYHLLDRVATQGSNVCLVGLTQHLALRSMLEKRIKSRMEGTSKEIFVGPCPSMNSLTNVILSHAIATPNSSEHNTINNENTTRPHPLKVLHDQMSQLLTPPTRQYLNQERESSSTDAIQQRVYDTLEREYRIGRNVRWFSRIFAFALSLYRGEWMRYRHEAKLGSPCPTFQARHIMEALVAQGASISVDPPGSSNSNSNQHTTQSDDKRKRSTNLVIMNDGGASQKAVDSRIQALMDLSGPQVALILSARRILARDAQWNGETTTPPPLTLARMLQELKSFKATQQRYSRHLLWIAFTELIETNLLRPAADHCGTGPFQYDHQLQTFNSIGEAEDVPLHLVVDINREVMEALKNNLLECSTALREWGRKTN